MPLAAGVGSSIPVSGAKPKNADLRLETYVPVCPVMYRYAKAAHSSLHRRTPPGRLEAAGQTPLRNLRESGCQLRLPSSSQPRCGGFRLVRDIRGLRPERPLLPSPDVRSVATRTTAARPSPGTRLGASAEPVLMIGLASNERALPLQNCRPQVFKACAVVLCSRRGQSVQAGSSTWDYTPRRGVALSRLPAFPP